MKVCLIHNTWERNARRGAEQFLVTVSAAMRARGDEVVVIATRPWGSEPETEAGVYFLGSGYHSLERWPMALRLVWHLFNSLNPLKYFQVRKILKKEQPDIIWTHNLIGLSFLIFKLCHGRRHLHTIHDIQLLHPSGLLMYGQEGMISSFPARAYQTLVRNLIPRLSVIISPSEWLLRLHLERDFFNHNQAVVIPNPIAFALTERQSRAPKPTFDFFYVGQIEKHKGVDILVEAFKQLEQPSARLRLVGDGSLLESLREKNIDPRIEFLGRQPSPRVKELMLASDCLVVPSTCYENQPTVILEAFATGLPVIGSCFGGVKEMLGNDSIQFEPTVAALSKKLAEVTAPGWTWPLSSIQPGLKPSDYLKKALRLV